MGQLVVLIVVIYLFVTYGFWNVVLVAIGIVVAVTLLGLTIDSLAPASVQPRARTRKPRPSGGTVATFPESEGMQGRIQTGLVIDEPWISRILGGEKTWEMRSIPTQKRERIALIRKGSLTIVGLATIADVLGPFSDEQIAQHFAMHRVPTHMIGKWRYAWVLEDVQMLQEPIAYVHKKGAVTFVSLDPSASRKASAADAIAP